MPPQVTQPPSMATSIPDLVGRAPPLSISIPSITPPSITKPSIHVPTGPFYTKPIRTDCATATPDPNNGHVPPFSCNAYWNFDPSFGATIFFAVAFGILIFTHSAQGIVFKKKRFAWVIVMGCIWEFTGFVTRAFGAMHQQSAGAATVTQIFVLLAPLWINAFVYMVFGRMIHFLVPSRRLFKVRASLITHIFVWLDIVTFIIQMIGGFMGSGFDVPAKQLRDGIHIYMAGISLQEGFIVLFSVMAIKLWREVSKAESQGLLVSVEARRWRQLAIALYSVLVLISIRIFFRLTEFADGSGKDNPIPRNETYFYVLDASPMLLCAIILSVLHPGRVLKGPGSEFPSLNKAERQIAKAAVKQAKEDAKIRGVSWLGRVKIGREVKRNEVYRLDALKHGSNSFETTAFMTGSSDHELNENEGKGYGRC